VHASSRLAALGTEMHTYFPTLVTPEPSSRLVANHHAKDKGFVHFCTF